MSQIVVHRNHRLPLAEVKRRAEGIASRLREEYGGSYAWAGDQLSFRCTGASGQLTVTRDSLEIRLDLGFLLGAFHSRIEREIHAVCNEHFGAEQMRAPAPPTRRPTRPKRAASTSRHPK